MFSAPMIDYLMGISSCNRYDGKDDDKSGFTANYINSVGATTENAKKSIEDCRAVLHQLVDSCFQSLSDDMTFFSSIMSYRGDPKGLFDMVSDYVTRRDAASRERQSYFCRNSFEIYKDFYESMVRKSLGSDYAGYYSKHGLGAFDWKPSDKSHRDSCGPSCDTNHTHNASGSDCRDSNKTRDNGEPSRYKNYQSGAECSTNHGFGCDPSAAKAKVDCSSHVEATHTNCDDQKGGNAGGFNKCDSKQKK